MANISARRFFVENTSLKFRRSPFFIGLEFIFAPEVYRVFIFFVHSSVLSQYVSDKRLADCVFFMHCGDLKDSDVN